MIDATAEDKREAYIIGRTQGLLTQDNAMFEPDRKQYLPTRIMILANKSDHSNCLVKYNPDELPPP